MQCLVCKAATDDGPSVKSKLRPLCVNREVQERGCHSRWWYSEERRRGYMQTKNADEPRAFMDWLNRVRAERRNAVPA